MWLAIDVGNTNAVLGLFSEAELLGRWRISTQPIGTGDEFNVKLRALLSEVEEGAASKLKDVVVSSVVPQFNSMLRHAFQGKVKLHIVDSSWPFSFKILANPPTQVGGDRLVNAEAVIRDFGKPAIIVDSGTATTVCAISKNGEYLGGAIMPGLELSLETLAKAAARLYMIELHAPEKAIGTNTGEALRSGILFGYAEMIDGMVRRFKAELGDPNAVVVATGGVAELLKGIAKELNHFDSDLTLRGIRYLYERKFSS